jgi:fucose permease
MALGMLCGIWGAHIPSVRAQYEIDEATLSVLLFAAAVGAVASLFIAGKLVARLGARQASALSALAMCLALGGVLEYPGAYAALPAMLVLGASLSLFDVAINTEGSVLESLGQRPIMSNLHGMFSVGGMAGAAAVAGLLWAGVTPRVQIPAICAILALGAAWSSRGMLATPDSAGQESGQAHFAWPRGLLLLIGLLIFAGMTAEGAMYDWCVLYLKQEVGMTQAHAALGYASFSAAMAASRFGGDHLRARHDERTLLRFGAAMATLAMAAVLLSAHPVVAMLGFAVVGAGLAPVAPILFNAATRVPGVSRAAAIASVTSVGYSGFLVGPPLIGAIATASSLTAALAVVVGASALLALGAQRVPLGTPAHQ